MATRIEVNLKIFAEVEPSVDGVNLGPYIRAVTQALEENTDFKVWNFKAKRVETVSFPITPRREQHNPGLGLELLPVVKTEDNIAEISSYMMRQMNHLHKIVPDGGSGVLEICVKNRWGKCKVLGDAD